MFLGHYAVGFEAKRRRPEASLGTTFLACQWIDLVWPIFLILGIEHARVSPGDTRYTPLEFYDYPWTHSLAAVFVWAGMFAVAWYVRRRRSATALVLGLVVLSHWFLDAVAHRPDLPLFPRSSTLIGFGLWNFVAATIVIESLLFIAAVAGYARATRATDRTGRWALWTLVGFLALISIANVMSPPPPSIEAVAWTALAAWLFPLWAGWADRHRAPA
jgi:membrane-bound metal-dependent hydrolase YbcI (DUF457 family)